MSTDLLGYHQWCISDSVAMLAYREAIRRVVRAADVVLDLGACTGILSYLACEAGAMRVFAIEPADIVAVVPEIAKENDCGTRITVHKNESFAVEPSEKA